MELPRHRPFGTGTRTEGVNSTHDFLSLYAHSSSQQDTLPSSSQGAYLKTHDFLQPLERGGKTCAKEEIANVPLSGGGKSTLVERLLPGGIGTYSISHVSNFNQIVPKEEGSFFRVAQSCNAERNEDNSNCSSFHGGGFSLWDESAGKMGKTGKENAGDGPCLKAESTTRIQSASMERPSQSSSSNHHNSFSSLSSSQPTRQKNQSFIEMIKSARGCSQVGEMDDEDEEFVIKKETSPIITGELRIKIDGKSSDQKANTPRSKHSVTEQRRRSKINDRFQMLREIIPRSDQKRDKASFLLEVVEYIQFLQEKVHKYESSYQGWNQESTKLVPWASHNNQIRSSLSWQSTNQRTSNQSQAIPGAPHSTVVFADKFNEKHVSGASQNPVDSETTTAPTIKAQMPLNHGRGNPTEPAIGNDKLKEQDLTIEAGTISISSVYSQGLLNSLTRALQSSGVDLSKASLSVQIELGKKTNGRANAHDSIVKDVGNPLSNLESTRFRVVAAGDPERALKKLKSGRS